jgi:hypothetical protein
MPNFHRVTISLLVFPLAGAGEATLTTKRQLASLPINLWTKLLTTVISASGYLHLNQV